MDLNKIVINDRGLEIVLIPKENFVKYHVDNYEIGLNISPNSVFRFLKHLIINRDNYMCQICGASLLHKKLVVHHIDYNHFNNSTDNLITLCKRCHYLVHFFCDKKKIAKDLIKILKKRGIVKNKPQYEVIKYVFR